MQKHKWRLFRGISHLSHSFCSQFQDVWFWYPLTNEETKPEYDYWVHPYMLLKTRRSPNISLLYFLIGLSDHSDGNTTIMTVICLHWGLRTPMYFFFFVLSCCETCYTLVIVPKMLTNLLFTSPAISFSGCAAQLYFFVGLTCTNCFLIAVMGNDHYVAICNPLNYTLIVNRATRLQLVLAYSFCGFPDLCGCQHPDI